VKSADREVETIGDLATSRLAAMAWRRFFARTIDSGLFYLLFSLLAPETANIVVLFAASQLLYIPIEALQIKLTGATLGKFLLKLRVVPSNGSQMDYALALKRACRVWVLGEACGVFIISTATAVTSYLRLIENGCTLWDKQCDTQVVSVELEAPPNREIGRS
jgi:uncharacterized RDD family membrane protein YckC